MIFSKSCMPIGYFILLPFKILSAKLQKIMIQAKEYPEKKISDAGIPVFDEEFLPIKEGGRRNEYISRGCLLVFTMKH